MVLCTTMSIFIKGETNREGSGMGKKKKEKIFFQSESLRNWHNP